MILHSNVVSYLSLIHIFGLVDERTTYFLCLSECQALDRNFEQFGLDTFPDVYKRQPFRCMGIVPRGNGGSGLYSPGLRLLLTETEHDLAHTVEQRRET